MINYKKKYLKYKKKYLKLSGGSDGQRMGVIRSPFGDFKENLRIAKRKLIYLQTKSPPVEIKVATEIIIKNLLDNVENINSLLSKFTGIPIKSYLILKGSNGVRLGTDDVDFDYDFDFKLISNVNFYKEVKKNIRMQNILDTYYDEILLPQILLFRVRVRKAAEQGDKRSIELLEQMKKNAPEEAIKKLNGTSGKYIILLHGFIASNLNKILTSETLSLKDVNILQSLEHYNSKYIEKIIKSEDISILPYKISVNHKEQTYAVCDIIFQLDKSDDVLRYEEIESVKLDRVILCDNILRNLLDYIYFYFNTPSFSGIGQDFVLSKKKTWMSMIEILLLRIESNSNLIYSSDTIYLKKLNEHLAKLIEPYLNNRERKQHNTVKKKSDEYLKYIELCRKIQQVMKENKTTIFIDNYRQIKKEVEEAAEEEIVAAKAVTEEAVTEEAAKEETAKEEAAKEAEAVKAAAEAAKAAEEAEAKAAEAAKAAEEAEAKAAKEAEAVKAAEEAEAAKAAEEAKAKAAKKAKAKAAKKAKAKAAAKAAAEEEKALAEAEAEAEAAEAAEAAKNRSKIFEEIISLYNKLEPKQKIDFFKYLDSLLAIDDPNLNKVIEILKKNASKKSDFKFSLIKKYVESIDNADEDLKKMFMFMKAFLLTATMHIEPIDLTSQKQTL